MKRLPQFRLLALAIFALGAGMCTAQGADAKSAAAAAKSEASKAKSGTNLESLRKQYSDLREAIVADTEALAKQYKDATAAEKEKIKARIEARKKEFDQQQAALHKQLRDEVRRQRTEGGKK